MEKFSLGPARTRLGRRAVGAALLALLAGLGSGARSLAAEPARVVLPTAVVPQHYDIDLAADAGRLGFKARVRIRLLVRRATRDIVLNAVDLDFDRVALTGRAAAPEVRLDPVAQTATLRFPAAVPPGRYTLAIDYRGRIYQQPSGLFALDYTGADGRPARALYTQFENSDARRFVPSWDEPGLKATFALTVTVPAGQLAVSNMPVAETRAAGEGLERVRFQVTPRMSSYLLFVASGDFERVHRQVAGVDLGVVVKRGDGPRAQFALESAAALLPYFNDYFGTPYGLPKLDMVAGPGESESFSAMENWGAIFYFDRDLLVDPRVSTLADRQDVYDAVAHEMSHQWFGDLVTMAWWDDLWLNEGFATWMATKVEDHFHPDWRMSLQAHAQTGRAMAIDAARGTHAIVTPIRDVYQAAEAFDAITYQKGAAVIRMLESYAGEAQFRAGVRRYIRAHAYGNAVSDDLWRAIDAAGPRRVAGIAHDFSLQAGVPLVHLTDLRCDGSRAEAVLEQHRFATDDSGATGAQRWHVPAELLNVGEALAASRAVVAGPAATTVGMPRCGPVILNAGQRGYFISRYASGPLAALAGRLGDLSADDQLGLIDDTASLAFAGTVPLAEFLALARRVPTGANSVVWIAVLARFDTLDRAYRDAAARARFRAAARGLFDPLLATLGWEPGVGESANAPLLRARLLDTLARWADPEVIEAGRRGFAAFRADPGSFTAAARGQVLRIAARSADAATWEQLRSLAASTTDVLKQTEYYELLGLATDPALAERALDLAVAGEVPQTMRPALIQSVAGEHPDLATRFVMARWATIEAWIEPTNASSFLPGLARGSAEATLGHELADFAEAHGPATARNSLEVALSRIRYRAALGGRLESLDDWQDAGAAH